MDAYHELTLGQAAHAYHDTQVAMAVGFVVLAAGAVAAVTISASDTGGRVVVGGLASIGTALSGYIVATFLRAQREALAQLNVYFRQPLINSYLLTAERWAMKLPKELRPGTLAHMADRVVSQAFGGAAASAAMPDGASVPLNRPVANGKVAANGHAG
jgi:hypothetical protein